MPDQEFNAFQETRINENAGNFSEIFVSWANFDENDLNVERAESVVADDAVAARHISINLDAIHCFTALRIQTTFGNFDVAHHFFRIFVTIEQWTGYPDQPLDNPNALRIQPSNQIVHAESLEPSLADWMSDLSEENDALLAAPIAEERLQENIDLEENDGLPAAPIAEERPQLQENIDLVQNDLPELDEDNLVAFDEGWFDDDEPLDLPVQQFSFVARWQYWVIPPVPE